MQDIREQVGSYLIITLLSGRGRLTKYHTNNILLHWNDERFTSPLLKSWTKVTSKSSRVESLHARRQPLSAQANKKYLGTKVSVTR
jgi:hypothetical protein